MHYPQSHRNEQLVENLHGREIADPYRWLEDPDSAETRAWVAAQNEITEDHLATLPAREWFAERMKAIVHRPRAGTPLKKAGRFYLNRNDGSQNQDVWFVASSVEELESGGSVIIDPNALSADGTTSVSSFTVNSAGTILSYAKSEGGSDWSHFVLVDPVTGEPVDDVEVVSKFSVPEWLPDNASYLYTSWPGADRTEGTATGALSGQRLMLHRIGSSDDELVLEFPDDPQLMFSGEVSHDDRLLIMSIARGTENTNRLWTYRIGETDGRSTLSEPIKIIDTDDAEYVFVRADGDRLILQTDVGAPRGRLVSVDLTAVEAGAELTLTELVAEGEDTLSSVVAAGPGLLMARLVDAQPQISRHDLDGAELGLVDISAGALLAVDGHADDPDAFVGVSGVTSPTSAYHLDTVTGAVRPLDLVRGQSGYTPPAITVSRRSATSADGTRVPYFLITRSGHDLSTAAPTLLYGYGGFKIPVMADYRPGWSAWLEAGGVLAIANLRGGGEFGTEWYDDGRLANKQHVFDDVIAVGADLCESGITRPSRLAIHGRSNGGLLVGAAMTQRPDLFAAAVTGVGVLDLLRFHKFTIGAAWISDYGNPDVAEDFEVAVAYSPLHNVREGTSYPATLVLTGDHDDRVVPLHSHKFTATLQRAQAGDAPVLARIETDTGHGMGKPTSMVAAEWADLLAFVAFHTDLEPAV